VSAVVSVQQKLGTGLGASEVASAIGLSPWERPIELWKRKTGRAPDKVQNDAMYWGSRLEPIIRAEYVERHQVEVEVPRASLYHPELSWARATPDGFVIVDGKRVRLVQCKAPGHMAAHLWGDDLRREVPDDYLAQAYFEMYVTGQRRVDFAVLLGGRAYFEVPVEWSDDLGDAIVTSAIEFWRCVEEDREPAFDNSEAHLRHLVAKIQRGGETIKADLKIEALAERWRGIVREKEALDTEERAIKGAIAQFMAAAGAARVDTSLGRLYVQNASPHYRDGDLARDLCTRLQLLGEGVDFTEERAKYKNPPGAPALRRPNKWTEE
jgi:putative phage-type endonuclease